MNMCTVLSSAFKAPLSSDQLPTPPSAASFLVLLPSSYSSLVIDFMMWMAVFLWFHNVLSSCTKYKSSFCCFSCLPVKWQLFVWLQVCILIVSGYFVALCHSHDLLETTSAFLICSTAPLFVAWGCFLVCVIFFFFIFLISKAVLQVFQRCDQ